MRRTQPRIFPFPASQRSRTRTRSAQVFFNTTNARNSNNSNDLRNFTNVSGSNIGQVLVSALDEAQNRDDI